MKKFKPVGELTDSDWFPLTGPCPSLQDKVYAAFELAGFITEKGNFSKSATLETERLHDYLVKILEHNPLKIRLRSTHFDLCTELADRIYTAIKQINEFKIVGIYERELSHGLRVSSGEGIEIRVTIRGAQEKEYSRLLFNYDKCVSEILKKEAPHAD